VNERLPLLRGVNTLQTHFVLRFGRVKDYETVLPSTTALVRRRHHPDGHWTGGGWKGSEDPRLRV